MTKSLGEMIDEALCGLLEKPGVNASSVVFISDGTNMAIKLRASTEHGIATIDRSFDIKEIIIGNPDEALAGEVATAFTLLCDSFDEMQKQNDPKYATPRLSIVKTDPPQ